MGVFSGPDINENGLVLALDAGNSKSFDSRENLVSYSTYSSLTWSNIFPAGATITTGIEAPDGTSTAVRFSCNNTTNALLRVSFPSFTPNGTDTYTTSFYVRRISGTGNAFTDLADGVPSTNYSSQLVTGQWVRIVTTGVPTATAKSFIDLYSDQNTNLVLDFWGVQVEKNPTVTTYTATSGSIVTRPTTWTDLSGSGNTGILTNGPTYNNDNGGSLVFDGSNDHITGTLPLIPLNSSATIEAIVRLNNTTGTKNIFTQGQNAVSFSCGMVIGENVMRFRNSNNDHSLSSPQTLSSNQWYHLVLSSNPSGTTGYVNAVSIGTTTQTITNNAVQTYVIGQRPSNASEYMNGNIAKVSVYNRALTEAEVQQNFNATRSRYGI